jgi:hypothetical protein
MALMSKSISIKNIALAVARIHLWLLLLAMGGILGATLLSETYLYLGISIRNETADLDKHYWDDWRGRVQTAVTEEEPESESDIIELAKKISSFSDAIMERAFPMESLDPLVAKISRDGFHPESPTVALKPESVAYSGPARNILRITWEFTGDRREGRYVRLDDDIIHSNGIVAVELKNNTNKVHEYMYPEICAYYATMLVGMDEQRFNAVGPSAWRPSYFKLNPGHVIRWNIDFRKNAYYKNAMGGSDLWPIQNGCHKVRFSFGGGFMNDIATVCYAGREEVLAEDDLEQKHSCSYLNPPLEVMDRQVPRKETLVSAAETCDFFDLKYLLDQQQNISRKEFDSAIRAAEYPCPMLADFISEYVTLKNIGLVSK